MLGNLFSMINLTNSKQLHYFVFLCLTNLNLFPALSKKPCTESRGMINCLPWDSLTLYSIKQSVSIVSMQFVMDEFTYVLNKLFTLPGLHRK